MFRPPPSFSPTLPFLRPRPLVLPVRRSSPFSGAPSLRCRPLSQDAHDGASEMRRRRYTCVFRVRRGALIGRGRTLFVRSRPHSIITRGTQEEFYPDRVCLLKTTGHTLRGGMLPTGRTLVHSSRGGLPPRLVMYENDASERLREKLNHITRKPMRRR